MVWVREVGAGFACAVGSFLESIRTLPGEHFSVITEPTSKEGK